MGSLINGILGYKKYDVVVFSPSMNDTCISAGYQCAVKKDGGILFSKKRMWQGEDSPSSNDWAFIPIPPNSTITSSKTDSEGVWCIKGEGNTIRIRGVNFL